MKLSIIIPVYNGSKFIHKSYQSVMNQDLDDYEIVYVDNNSKDDSVKIIETLQKENDNVKLYFQTRQGEAQARNKGIEMAIGEYYHQLDVDDELYPRTLKKMIAVLDENPKIEAVFGKMVKSDKNMANTVKPDDETNEVVIKDKPYWGLKWFSDLSSVVGEAAYMHRKEVFQKIGSYSEQLPIIGTDLAFDVKLGMTCNVAFIDTYIYMYFKHSVSIIEKVKQKMPRAFMVWPRLVKEHLPFYLNNETPLQFKKLLYGQLYKSLCKQVYHTKGFIARNTAKKSLLAEIDAIKVHPFIRYYLLIMVIFPFSYVMKFYLYYIVPYVVKRIKN